MSPLPGEAAVISNSRREPIWYLLFSTSTALLPSRKKWDAFSLIHILDDPKNPANSLWSPLLKGTEQVTQTKMWSSIHLSTTPHNHKQSKFRSGPKGCGGWCTACILGLQRIMPCFCIAADFPTESHILQMCLSETLLFSCNGLFWHVLPSFQNLLRKTPLSWVGKRVTWSLFWSLVGVFPQSRPASCRNSRS